MLKDLVDYSPHELEAKKLIHSAADFLRRNRYTEALESIEDAIVELRLMRAAIKSHIEK